MNTNESAIYDKKDEGIQGYYQMVADTITPLLTDDNYIKYGVNQETLDAIGKQVDRFHGMIGLSTVNASGYTTANSELDGYLKDIAANVEQFDLLVEDFADDYPQFVQGYYINSRLGDDVMRHNGIQGTVTIKQTGVPVKGAVITLEGTDKTALTDITGNYRLTEMKPGFYYVVVQADGFANVRLLHRIVKSVVEKLNFEL